MLLMVLMELPVLCIMLVWCLQVAGAVVLEKRRGRGGVFVVSTWTCTATALQCTVSCGLSCAWQEGRYALGWGQCGRLTCIGDARSCM